MHLLVDRQRGRAGLLGMFLILGIYITFEVLKENRQRLILILSGLLAAPIVYVGISSRAISGRGGLGSVAEEQRLDVWREQLTALSNQGEWVLLFGEFLGSGTNAIRSIAQEFEVLAFEATTISDSVFIFYIKSFGLVGALLLVLPLLLIMLLVRSYQSLMVCSLFLFLGLAEVVFEIHPANLVLMITLGLIVYDNGTSKQQPTNRHAAE